MYNLNRVIAIIFNCTCAYARGYTLVNINMKHNIKTKINSNSLPKLDTSKCFYILPLLKTNLSPSKQNILKTFLNKIPTFYLFLPLFVMYWQRQLKQRGNSPYKKQRLKTSFSPYKYRKNKTSFGKNNLEENFGGGGKITQTKLKN